MKTLSPFRGWQFLLCVGLLAGSAGRASAQTTPNTTDLKYGEEARRPPAADAPLRVQEEQRHVWKLGLNNVQLFTAAFGPDSYYTRYGFHLAYERKLNDPAWSVLGEVSPALGRYRSEFSPQSRRGLSVRSQVAGRYYYNREQRLRKGRYAGNFSANYLSVALGAGWGKEAHETPFFLYQNDRRRFATADVALLYGLQRRLGRYGFVDANIGAAALLLAGKPVVGLGSSLRIGFTLGAQPPEHASERAPAREVVSLQPRYYAGASIGGYFYRVRYSEQNPYPAPVIRTSPTETQTTNYPASARDGYGSYAQYVSAGPVPYLYAGYHVAPRFAVQLGVQYGETFNEEPVGTVFNTAEGPFTVPNQVLTERGLALPVLVRYALTPSFLRRVQFTGVGGLVPVWSTVTFREYAIANRQLTAQETFEFQRRAFGLHATLGLDASYAFGRRRRVQATAEFLLNKDVQTIFQAGRHDPASGAFLAGGGSFGLRYRFGYR
ncbi:hypothetical protein GCM10011495_35740 [Hymenobacter frigidus]|uniref:Outer membrane protein beta-barrel domain-containing protein n=1 Tax=Hymenobacter frigidus TaxID=1524095 RepID=A0ABQ2AH98_9BACT|nr:hypothetical protein [Hymenobacter frigidus]GGH90264.1 hypothetical protein GCM10011495_35740 [Hymenobacter frigidus]